MQPLILTKFLRRTSIHQVLLQHVLYKSQKVVSFLSLETGLPLLKQNVLIQLCVPRKMSYQQRTTGEYQID